jgi:hypothetical protein
MARIFGVKTSTIKWMSSPTGLKRSLKKGRMIVIKIEEEDDHGCGETCTRCQDPRD